jgi:hypothetical protein
LPLERLEETSKLEIEAQQMADILERARERSVATCNLALLLERRGKRQLEKSLRRLEFGATSAYGKHDRRIKLLEIEHKKKLSNDVVSNLDRYFDTKCDHLVGSHRKNTKSQQLGLSYTCSHPITVDICSGKKCLHFPCRREQTYHFMFDTSHAMKESREFLWRQKAALCAGNTRLDREDEESRSSTPVSFKGTMDPDGTGVQISDPLSILFDQHSGKFKKSNLTKKEFFLKSTVQSKKNAVPRKIDISVNYGKPTPWRILLRPVRPGRSAPLHTSGKKILAF